MNVNYLNVIIIISIQGWLPLCFTFISEPTSSGSQYTPPSVFDPHGTHQASSVQSSGT